MRLLVLDWEFINKKELYAAFDRMGVSYDLFTVPADVYIRLKVDDAVEILLNQVKKGRYDAGFSIDFFSSFAEACHRIGIPYFSWSYDTPSFIGDSKYRAYDTNHCFLFDSHEYENRLKAGDCGNLYHLNLAVQQYDFKKLRLKAGQERLSADVSFVGKMYYVDLDNVYAALDTERASALKQLINFQVDHEDINVTDEFVTVKISEELLTREAWNAYVEGSGNSRGTGYARIFQYDDYNPMARMKKFLENTATYKQRVLLLEMLARRLDLALYTQDEDNDFVKNADYRGVVDYDTEMPKVFYNSKININTTSRNIKNGIPKRCLDIMAAGGFLLTDDQKDLYTELEDKKDMVVYHNIAEACELADYYLKHDTERQKIAMSGYHKMKECFSYERQLSKIFSVI